eukprot:853973-Alexandrium_andersonii.AAC.2
MAQTGSGFFKPHDANRRNAFAGVFVPTPTAFLRPADNARKAFDWTGVVSQPYRALGLTLALTTWTLLPDEAGN